VWLIIADMLRVALRSARGLPTLASSETPFVARIPIHEAASGGRLPVTGGTAAS